MLDCPILDSLNQTASDCLPVKSLVNNKTANLYPVVRLQKLRKHPMYPANQSTARQLSHKNNIAGTGKQSLKPQSHHIAQDWISKLTGKACYLLAILLLCFAK
jgi:hypothetical protein